MLIARLSGVALGLAAVLFCVLPGAAWAGPAADELGDLAEPLNKEVKIDLIGTPLPRALETVARQAELNIIISPQYVSALSGNIVNLTIDGLTATKTLNLIGIATDTDWYIREGVVLFAPRKYVRSLRIERRVYDIRELLESVPNYLGPDLSIDGTLSNTSSGGSDARQSESYSRGGSGGGLFGDDDSGDLGEDTPSRDELISQIVSLIQSTIGEPGQWLEEESSVTEFNGSLIVNTVPEELDEIGQLLDSLSAAGGRMITTEGQFFVVPRGMMDDLDGGLVLDAQGYAKFAEKLERNNIANVRRIASGRTICFNSQRVYVYAGSDRALLSDLEPVPDAAGVDPTLSTAKNGAVFDLKPTITLDGKHISVAVRTEAVDRADIKTTPVPVGRVIDSSTRLGGSGSVEGTVKGAGPKGEDAEIEGTANIGGSVGGPDSDVLTGNASVGLPEQDILRHRTNVRVPNGGAVVMSGVTNQYKGIDADALEVIFVLRMRIVQ